MNVKIVRLLIVAAMLNLLLGGLPLAAQEEGILLGLSVSTQGNPFYRNLAEGVVAEAEALGVEVTVLSADDDLAKQISDVEDLIAAGVDALLINATQAEAVGVIEQAALAGIPVVTLQRAVGSSLVTAHIGTDNVLIGRLAAEWLINRLGGQGRIVVLEGIPGAASSEDRKTGSTPVFEAAEGIEIVAQQTAEYDRATALTVMENILQATPDIDAVFCYNDEMAMGAIAALEAAGRDDVIVIGIDALPDALEAVRDGSLAMTIRIPVYDMGRLGTRYALEAIAGNMVPVNSVIPIEFITQDNVDAPPPEMVEGPITLGVSVSTQGNPFYQQLAQGTADEAAALGYEATVLSADDDLAKQVSDVEDLIAAGVNALLINPTQAEAVGVIEQAAEAGIPVVTMQRAVGSSLVTAHIGTDNVLIGRLAAEWLINRLGGQGRIVVLEGIPGAASSEDRKTGSTPVFEAAAPGIEIVAQQTAEYDRATALTVMENILQATPDIDAVFCYNDEMAMGAIAALEAAGRDDVIVIGIDALPDALEAVRDGSLAMTIRIPVYDMGRWATRFGVWAATGDIAVPVNSVIPIEFITQETLAE